MIERDAQVAQAIERAKIAIGNELPEDEPDTIPDWCYRTIVESALRVLASPEHEKDHGAGLAAVPTIPDVVDTVPASSIVLCRCGHERDKHGSRTEMRRGEKVYVQKCECCPCEVFTNKDGPLSRLIDSFRKVDHSAAVSRPSVSDGESK